MTAAGQPGGCCAARCTYSPVEVAPGLAARIAMRSRTGPMRTLIFGSSGAVEYLILEHQREVHVLLVQWIG